MTTEPTASILIVDDDLRTLKAMEALLAGPGRMIVKAQSGQEALRCLLRQDFALILLDVRMPGMDGFETAQLIRQRERSRYTPIIFVSAVDTLESDVHKGVSSGAVDYLFKPVVPEVLKSKVSVFVDLFHMNERLKHQALRQSEERFRLLVECLQDYSVVMLDTEGRVITWNVGAERITGYRLGEIIGQSFARFYTPEDQAKNVPAYALRCAREQGRYEQESWRFRKDGSRYWANMVVTALRDDHGNLVGFSEITRDLTERKRVEEEMVTLNAELEGRVAERTADLLESVKERKRVEEQLWQVQKMESIGTLAGGMAHSFNNILAIILGYVSRLGQDEMDSAERSESVDAIRSASERGRHLVHQLLTFARRTEVAFEGIDVNGEVRDVAEMLAQVFPKEITISLDLDSTLPSMRADRNQFHQAMINLCINARDAMPEGGTLFLKTEAVEGKDLSAKFSDARGEKYVCIRVGDAGVGMDEEVRRHLFVPFFTTKDTGKGTGLGLAVAYGIVTSHGGYIHVESDVGRGSTFYLYFPLEPLAAETVRGLVLDLPKVAHPI
ncbi:MAG: PAS domain S-box protein [Deltaproteobacteria bacterium]|nr:PAS domain S-box protein [Deltaproteobacteria bacterium]